MDNNGGFVDLGLSVKWATCNLGATKPEEFGDYISWDELETKFASEYQIPTVEQLKELRYRCRWEWTKINNVAGYKVYSKVEGLTDHFIFLPAAGYIDNDTPSGVGSFGAYWSNSLVKEHPKGAYYLYYNSEAYGITDYYRRCKQSIRLISSL